MNLTLGPDFMQASEDLWVFAYGSLMWRPDFTFIERVPARTIGLHRSLCVYSWFHRGTQQNPGLVLGLDRGGACLGIAYRVPAENRAVTIAYLRAREQVTHVYRESLRGAWLAGRPERRVDALCYVVNRSHPQYAGALTVERQLHLVRHARGQSGANRDYVLATVAELDSQGFRDNNLHLLAEQLKGVHEAH